LWMPEAVAVYGAGALLMVAVTVWATVKRWGWNDAAMGALVAAFPNSGFMGLPLVAALVGTDAAGPAMMVIAVDMVITSSLCVALSRLGRMDGLDDHSRTQRWWLALRRAVSGVLRNPMPWAIGLGALASGLQWQLPSVMDRTVGMLADAASPVALFTIGAVLARAQMQQTLAKPARTVPSEHGLSSSEIKLEAPISWGSYVPIALAKLAVHPALIAGLAMAAAAMGYPMPHMVWVVLVMMAALPSASNVSLLAERLHAHSGRIAMVILMSTVLAVLSFPAVVAMVLP
jgi:malonate transporter and related proteins